MAQKTETGLGGFSWCIAGVALLGLAGCDMPAETAADGSSTAGAASAEASGGVARPASLSADERVIWNSLTEDARREAAEFIRNGGTLTQFVAV